AHSSIAGPAAASRLVHTSAQAGDSAASAPTGPLRVCVVGGGVVGLTCALRLLQLNQDAADPTAPTATTATTTPAPLARPIEVTVLAAGFGADTTTAGAAGLWGPYKLSGTEALICRWGSATYDHLMDLAHSGLAAEAGVSLCAVNSLYPQPEELPFWRHIPYNFQLLDDRMLNSVGRVGAPSSSASTSSSASSSSFATSPSSSPPSSDPPPLRCRWGYHWNSVVCEGTHYLPFLTAAVETAGGRLQRRRLAALSELDGGSVDLVVNAAGLGARELLGDGEVYPIRGQILRVRAPWVTQASRMRARR
ncbi:D-aspartate oxidase, partial [Tetrabaena socialis]